MDFHLSSLIPGVAVHKGEAKVHIKLTDEKRRKEKGVCMCVCVCVCVCVLLGGWVSQDKSG